MDLAKKIYKELKKEFKNLRKEDVALEDYLIEDGYIKFDNNKIKVSPISLGFRGKNKISSDLVYLPSLKGDILLNIDKYKNKILYIQDIEKHIYLKYLFLLKPLAVITNSFFGRKVYSPDFPILSVYSFLNDISSIEIDLKIQRKKYKSQNIFIDFGLGGNFIIILFPFDSRFQNFEDLSFYGSFKLFYYLLKRFRNYNSNIYRVRFLAIDFKYTNYYLLYEHLKKLDNIIAIYNIENSGVGNEKLIAKTFKYIIDRYHYKEIIKYFNSIKKPVKPSTSEEFTKFPIEKPIIWFNSQPNINLYRLDKNFFNEKFALELSQDIFEIIKNSYKEKV